MVLTFAPVVENPDGGLFLTEEPLTLLQEGRFNKVPTVQGVNRDEGCIVYAGTCRLTTDSPDFHFQ